MCKVYYAPINKSYDGIARLLSVVLTNNQQSTLDSYQYAYDLGSERTNIVRTDQSYVNYGYDKIGQLTNALGSGGQSTENLGYGYDAGWNLSAVTNHGTGSGYPVNSLNELTGGAYAYDANGNRTTDASGNLTYTYDDENRLTKVVDRSSWRTDFAYDGLGRLRLATAVSE